MVLQVELIDRLELRIYVGHVAICCEMKDTGDHPPICRRLKLILAPIRVKIRFLRCVLSYPVLTRSNGNHLNGAKKVGLAKKRDKSKL